MDHPELFNVLLLLTAFLYAAVGHGGASGYLALMAIYGFSPDVMKPTALLLNLFVSLTAFIQYFRNGHFKMAIFLPLALSSIPMAFLGGMVEVDAHIYKKILGVLLLLPIVRFLFLEDRMQGFSVRQDLKTSIIMGTCIGLLSGLIGIGGGIILSPLLLMLGWTDQKQTAAISALFIFVNSLSGLGGQLLKGIHFSQDMLAYVALAFTGGLAGAYLGARRFDQSVIRILLAVVLMVASYKLLFTNA